MSTEANEGLARVVAVRDTHRGVLTKLLRESEEILKNVPIPEESFEKPTGAHTIERKETGVVGRKCA